MPHNVKRRNLGLGGLEMKALAADDPQVIGEYRLQARLGAGGMGRVYLGLSPGGRAVAIKVVNPDLASDPEFLHRFQQEVAAARAVSGIYTAPVVASGLDERPPWLATAFVPGPSLDEVVAEHGPLPEAALWPLLAGLVEALQAIHDCGVVHRDLKPANVLLATDGPRVIDFGISRAAGRTALTAAGMVFGTVGYMAPEQAEGLPAGPASDVFALGCVIAYAATGAGPFGAGTAAAVLYRVVHVEPVLDGVPQRLQGVISACLTKDPAARPRLRALSAAIANSPDAAGPSTVAFWPPSIAALIGAYQADLEQRTRTTPSQALEQQTMTADRPYPEFATPAAVYPPTLQSDPGRVEPSQSDAGRGGPSQPPQPGSRGYQAQPASPGPLASPGAGREEYAAPQAYRSTQDYPQPQGYAGPQPQGYGAEPHGYGSPPAQQAPGAPPAGYLAASGVPASGAAFPPGAGPASNPQPYQLGSIGAVYELPPSMTTAIRLMYAGAAYSLVYGIAVVGGFNSVINRRVAGEGQVNQVGLFVVAIVVALIEAAVWLWVARACKNRRNSARVTGTVLFGLHTLGTFAVVANSNPGLGPTKAVVLIGWLIACAAVVFLWRRSSSAFFAATAPGRF
jgi:serine/threonine protein kinase